MNRQIIGMVGFAGSGKDTVASHIVDNYRFSRISFAKALKDVLSSMFGWDRELLEGTTKESREWRDIPDMWWEDKLDWSRHPMSSHSERFTPRVALQLIGTQTIRGSFCDGIWTYRVEHYINHTKGDIIITDCRFKNELDMVRNMGGTIIRVKRGPDPEWYDIACDANNPSSPTHGKSLAAMMKSKIHISEWDWAGYDFDITIENNGTLGQLVDRIDTEIMNDRP